jgi:hypothetical protein
MSVFQFVRVLEVVVFSGTAHHALAIRNGVTEGALVGIQRAPLYGGGIIVALVEFVAHVGEGAAQVWPTSLCKKYIGESQIRKVSEDVNGHPLESQDSIANRKMYISKN